MEQVDDEYRERLKAWERDLIRREVRLAGREASLRHEADHLERQKKSLKQQISDGVFRAKEEAFLDLWGLIDGLQETAAGRKRLQGIVRRQKRLQEGRPVKGPSARPLSAQAFSVVKQAVREAERAERREKLIKRMDEA